GREARGGRGDGAAPVGLSRVALLERAPPVQAGGLPQAGTGGGRLDARALVPARLGDHAPAAPLRAVHAAAARPAGCGVTLALGVLASGRGSNLQSILDACAPPAVPA